MKPIFCLVAQTWNQLRRLSNSDALAAAVLMQAVWSGVHPPYKVAISDVPPKWRRWRFLLPLPVLSRVVALFWGFDSAARLRRHEKTAWWLATVSAVLTILFCVNILFFAFLLRNGLHELTEEDQQRMTKKQIASYNATLEKARAKPLRPLLTPGQVVSTVISLALALRVLRCALLKRTPERFNSRAEPEHPDSN